MMADLLEPELRELKIGAAEVRQIFPVSKGFVPAAWSPRAASTANAPARVRRGKEVVFEGRIRHAPAFQGRRQRTVRAGLECGIPPRRFSTVIRRPTSSSASRFRRSARHCKPHRGYRKPESCREDLGTGPSSCVSLPAARDRLSWLIFSSIRYPLSEIRCPTAPFASSELIPAGDQRLPHTRYQKRGGADHVTGVVVSRPA